MRTNKISIKNLLLLTEKMHMVKQIHLIIFAGILFTAISCKKDSTTNSDVTFTATLNGASEVPANASTATGSATMTFNTSTKIFTIVVNFTGIEATASHIHKGAVGESGGVVFGFPSPIISPIYYTSVALDASQEADLNAGLYYVNIHSAEFPDGEIRGQLIKQ